MTKKTAIILTSASLFLIIFAGIFWTYGSTLGEQKALKVREISSRGELDADEKNNINLFKQSSPSVVHITTSGLARDFYSFDIYQIPKGSGTGFIWDKEGHVVTNFHVIQNAALAKVTLSDRSMVKAKLVGYATAKDLAVLKIEVSPDKLQPIKIGTSQDLQVGQKVFAIGNPFGFDQTLTTGIISGLGREIKSVTDVPIKDVIQTDAAINPGNSGGPLLDSSGRLIGVNTAIYSPSGAYAGVGFAIPVDTVNWVIPELITNGKITRPGLGVSMASDQINWELNIPGVLVLEVEPGSSAAKAGLQATYRNRNGEIVFGDIITEVDSEPVKSSNDLSGIIQGYKVGDTVTLTLLRNKKTTKVKITLQAMKSIK